MVAALVVVRRRHRGRVRRARSHSCRAIHARTAVSFICRRRGSVGSSLPIAPSRVRRHHACETAQPLHVHTRPAAGSLPPGLSLDSNTGVDQRNPDCRRYGNVLASSLQRQARGCGMPRVAGARRRNTCAHRDFTDQRSLRDSVSSTNDGPGGDVGQPYSARHRARLWSRASNPRDGDARDQRHVVGRRTRERLPPGLALSTARHLRHADHGGRFPVPRQGRA